MKTKTLTAFCWRSGLLQVAREAPEGALVLATAPDKVMTDAISKTARLAYDGESWLVPGVPEAGEDSDAAVDAVIDYQRHLNKRLALELASQSGGDHVGAESASV
jgi:hypothetical protein